MPHPFTNFYRGKRVLVTGHTGFQGGWAVAWLKFLGAQVCGYGLPPAARPNFFDATLLDRGMTSIFADVRDRNSLANAFTEFQPEIVIHCATRSTPQLAHREPVETFHTNVMGTVFIHEEARLTNSVRAIVNISGAEIDEGSTASKGGTGADVHNASMACVELVGSAFTESFFRPKATAAGTARVADVIGGGDWREGRTVPNLVRSIMCGEPVDVVNGPALHIWHVLEPVCAYLLLGQKLFEDGQKYSGVWEFSSQAKSPVLASELAKQFVTLWDAEELTPNLPEDAAENMVTQKTNTSREAQLGWSNRLKADETIGWTVEWYRAFYADSSTAWRITEDQIARYMRLATA